MYRQFRGCPNHYFMHNNQWTKESLVSLLKHGIIKSLLSHMISVHIKLGSFDLNMHFSAAIFSSKVAHFWQFSWLPLLHHHYNYLLDFLGSSSVSLTEYFTIPFSTALLSLYEAHPLNYIEIIEPKLSLDVTCSNWHSFLTAAPYYWCSLVSAFQETAK